MLGLTSKAQFGEKGQRLISAGFGVNSLASSGNNQTLVNGSAINLNVSMGKFKKQNVLTSVAIYGGYLNSDNSNFSAGYNNKNYNLGASFNKTHYKPIAKGLFVGIGGSAGVNYNYSRHISTIPNSPIITSKVYGVNFALAPSLSYQISKRFVANLSTGNSFLNAGYSYNDVITRETGLPKSKSKQQSIYLNAGFFSAPLQNLTVSFSYLLKRV
jgi:hypothetical protein